MKTMRNAEDCIREARQKRFEKKIREAQRQGLGTVAVAHLAKLIGDEVQAIYLKPVPKARLTETRDNIARLVSEILLASRSIREGLEATSGD